MHTPQTRREAALGPSGILGLVICLLLLAAALWAVSIGSGPTPERIQQTKRAAQERAAQSIGGR